MCFFRSARDKFLEITLQRTLRKSLDRIVFKNISQKKYAKKNNEQEFAELLFLRYVLLEFGVKLRSHFLLMWPSLELAH